MTNVYNMLNFKIKEDSESSQQMPGRMLEPKGNNYASATTNLTPWSLSQPAIQ